MLIKKLRLGQVSVLSFLVVYASRKWDLRADTSALVG